MILLADVIEALTHFRPAMPDLAITEAAIDSRAVIAGAMFVAIPGEKVDGHNYVAQAFERGAAVALIEHPLSEPFAVIDLRNGLPAEGPALPAPALHRTQDGVPQVQVSLSKGGAFDRLPPPPPGSIPARRRPAAAEYIFQIQATVGNSNR